MTLNEAIFSVLRTQYKKDMDKEALRMIEEAGYKIYKGDKRYCIKNPATNRDIYIQDTYYYGHYRVEFNWYTRGVKFDRDKKCPFDFVNCLNTPLNTVWYNLDRITEYHPTKDKYSKIKDARWDVNYHTKQVEDIVNEKLQKLYKQIEELTRDIQYHTEQRVKAKEELAELRKGFGLK